MAHMRLTESIIKKLEAPASGRLSIPVDECPGLALRVSKGAKVWSYLYRVKDQAPARITLGRWPDLDLAGALDAALAARVKRAKGDDPAAERREARTQAKLSFVELCDRFCAEYGEARKRPASVAEDRRLLSMAQRAWAGRAASTIRQTEVVALLDNVTKTTPTQANRLRAVLSKCFVWGASRGLVAASPVAGTERPHRTETKRERRLSDDELRRLLAELADPLSLIETSQALCLRLILATACRPAEAAELPWAELDLANPAGAVWRMPAKRSKSRHARAIPLSKLAVEIIEAARAEGAKRAGAAEYVFPSWKSTGSIQRHSVSASLLRLTRGHYEPFVPHDLRRTAASIANEDGASDAGLKALLGHAATTGATVIYARGDHSKAARHAVELIEARLRKLMAATKPA
jgi:integrase